MNEPQHSTHASPPKTARRFGMRGRVCVGLVIIGVGVCVWLSCTGLKTAVAGHESESSPRTSEGRRVEVVEAQAGGPARFVSLPGTVRAFDYASLFARVSGFLKTQSVDIGDHVQ